MIDFTGCKRVAHKAYNGANGKKIAIEYEGGQYMLKFPDKGTTDAIGQFRDQRKEKNRVRVPGFYVGRENSV